MSPQPADPYEDEESNELAPASRFTRREGLAIDLTGMGARIAATAVVIGIGVLVIFVALRPRGGESAENLPPVPTVAIDRSLPIATFTPGPTSTPPPLDVPPPQPTAAPGSENPPPTGALVVGGQAKVAGTDGVGVNMRGGSGTGFDILRTLGDDTVVSLIGGPTDADGYTWWQIRLEDGTEGWVAQNFLAP